MKKNIYILKMLAGLIDTDGSLTQGGYDIIFKSKILADDTAFIARSCGLAAYVKPCVKASQKGTKGTYYRISVSGDCSVIPCRLPYKVAPRRKQKKSVLRTGLSVEYLCEGEYVGFTVGPENHYVMGDFTVTHNCGKTVVFADVSRRMYEKTGRRVMVIAHREELIFQARDKIMTFAGLEFAQIGREVQGLVGISIQQACHRIHCQASGGNQACRRLRGLGALPDAAGKLVHGHRQFFGAMQRATRRSFEQPAFEQ